jgi:hypothetical protein
LESIYYRLNFPQIDPQKTGFSPSFLFLRHSSGCTIALVEPSGVKWVFLGPRADFKSISPLLTLSKSTRNWISLPGKQGWGTSLANAEAEVQGRKPGAAAGLEIDRAG